MIWIKTQAHSNELYHHGIKGQKWGERNGPPYPLKAGAHSAAEQKYGSPNENYGGKRQNNSAKIDDSVYTIPSKNDLASSGLKLKTGPSSILDDCKAVNPKYRKLSLSTDYSMNCTNCVMAYSLRRMGLDVEAQPLSTGRQLCDINRFFEGSSVEKSCKVVQATPKKDTAATVKATVRDQCLKMCGESSTGVGYLAIRGQYMAHVFSWEKTKSGKVIFVDPQSNHVDDRVIDSYFAMVSKGKPLAPVVLVARFDNCTVNTSALNEICKNH